MGKNVASGKDKVAVQGQVKGDKKDPKPEKESGTTTNICTGNARVGVQAGNVVGPVNVQQHR